MRKECDFECLDGETRENLYRRFYEQKKFLQIGCTFVFLCLFLAFTSSWRKKNEEPDISFLQEYAQEGKALNVVCSNYPNDTTFSFEWFIDGIRIDNTTDTYVPVYEDMGKFIQVTVTPDHGYLPTELTMYFSRLPVLYIDVADGDPIYSKELFQFAYPKREGVSI